jgi:hypothetical protein
MEMGTVITTSDTNSSSKSSSLFLVLDEDPANPRRVAISDNAGTRAMWAFLLVGEKRVPENQRTGALRRRCEHREPRSGVLAGL